MTDANSSFNWSLMSFSVMPLTKCILAYCKEFIIIRDGVKLDFMADHS